MTQKPSTRCEASGILIRLLSLEMVFMSLFWGDILERFNICNKKLQSVDIDLSIMVEIYQSLTFYIKELRTDNTYEYYKKMAIEKSGIEDFTTTKKRKKQRKTFSDDGPASDDSNIIDFKVTTYMTILDKILSELQKRKQSYDELFNKYQFLFCLTTITNVEVREKANKLLEVYPED